MFPEFLPNPWFYKHRELVSWFSALVLLTVIWGWVAITPTQKIEEKMTEMQAVLELSAPPLPSKPIPPEVAPPKLEPPRVKELVVKETKPEPQPLTPLSSTPSADPVSTQATPSVTAHESVTQPSSTVTHSLPTPTSTPVQTSPKVSASDLYMAKALEHLNHIKRYPTSREARLTHPQGTVKLKVLIQRDGSVSSVELTASSGSNLLDNEALRTVKNTQFPAIPEDAFPGESQHFVMAALMYQVPGQ